MENIMQGQGLPLSDGRLERAFWAIDNDLASPEEAELSPESAQLFLKEVPDKHKSSLLAMMVNDKTIQ